MSLYMQFTNEEGSITYTIGIDNPFQMARTEAGAHWITLPDRTVFINKQTHDRIVTALRAGAGGASFRTISTTPEGNNELP